MIDTLPSLGLYLSSRFLPYIYKKYTRNRERWGVVIESILFVLFSFRQPQVSDVPLSSLFTYQLSQPQLSFRHRASPPLFTSRYRHQLQSSYPPSPPFYLFPRIVRTTDQVTRNPLSIFFYSSFFNPIALVRLPLPLTIDRYLDV